MPVGGSGGGGGSGGLVKLLTVTRGSTGALDTGAGAIPAGHGHLVVYFICRSAAAAAGEAYALTFNGDGGANYDEAMMQGSSSGSSGVANAGVSVNAGALLEANTGTANYASALILDIPFYDNTNWFKTGTIGITVPDGGAANVRIAEVAWGWRNTAAISRITLDSVSHFLTNSSMVVFAVQ